MRSSSLIQTPKSLIKKEFNSPKKNLLPSPPLAKIAKKKAVVENDDAIFTTIYDAKLKGIPFE